jgi:hypothetical protein
MEHFFERSIPDMLHHLTLHFSVDKASCGYFDDQETRIATGHIHRDVLEKAYMFICDKKNIRQTRVKGSLDTFVWFVNSSANIYEETTKANAVTEARISALHNIQDKNCSIEEFRYRHLGLRTVMEINRPDGTRRRLICDCPFFWMCNSYCSHVVAVYHLLKVVNVFNLMSSLKAPKKRGRPTTRETALERDKDLLSTHMFQKPHHYKSTPLYHPEYGLGAAYEAYIHLDEKPVWKVRFPNAPGGMQDYEVRQPEMERCLRAFKSQLSEASQVKDPHQKK